MRKEVKINVVFLLVVILTSGFIGYLIPSGSNPSINESTLQSKCYTSLQPSKHLSLWNNYAMGMDTINGKIVIDYDSHNYLIASKVISNTGSMRPTYPDGAIVLSIEPKAEDIKVGDIISFRCNNSDTLIHHRVIQINETGYLTKGDNNLLNDLQAFGCMPKFGDIYSLDVGVLY